MATRLVYWFTYGVVFALIPLVASLLIHYFLGTLALNSITRSPELLFFSLMINATALGDLSQIGKPKKHDITIGVIKSGLMIGVIMSAILYGAFLFASTAGTIDADFAFRVFVISLILSLISLGVSTTGEVFLARISKP